MMNSERLKRLPPYLFVEIDRLRESCIRSGKTVLDLGIGDPDIGAPAGLALSLASGVGDHSYDRYPPGRGLPVLIEAIRAWAGERHGVDLESEEVLITIGSKEAIGHLPLAVVDRGDVVFIPDPGYPVYLSSAVFAEAECVRFPLLEERRYWPDFSAFEVRSLERAKLIYLNYPNNPTAATADAGSFSEAVRFCAAHGITCANDAAYCEITFEDPAIPLFPIAREAAIPYIEFFSFSKTFCITGWRIGFAVGSPDVISALAKIKDNIDSGVFGAIQRAIADALENSYDEYVSRTRSVFRQRRDILASHLERAGLSFTQPEATFYFWIRTPGGMDSIAFCRLLIEELGIVATPGVGFGPHGEGYFRLSLTTATEVVEEAGRRLESVHDILNRT
ncbi:MAG: aminotransferase class I/II-fold pyridoxal phosphate-dependent enzyme [bacterium]|nr:MAG: aminotransferase class I/II-fold pyridoxal phosphate-dependent enzyme [bacterium]